MTTESRRGMDLWYFGADGPWERLRHRGLRRRNTWMLKALSEHPAIDRVYNARWVLRSEFMRCVERTPLPAGRGGIVDVWLCAVVPAWLPLASRLNQLSYRLQIVRQTGRWPHATGAIWCYWPEGFRFASAVGLAGTWVFDADHDLLHDENRTAGGEQVLIGALQSIASQSSLVVAGSRSILEWFARNGARRTGRIRNGAGPCRPLPARRPPGNNIRVAYAGTLSNWIDYRVLAEIAIARPAWRIGIAGAPHRADAPAELRRLPNIEFVGEIDPDRLGGWLATFDAALGLYRREPWLDVDSMKLFDYLAAGVRVVSTPYHDALDADFDGLLDTASTGAEFVAAIEKIVADSDAARREWDVRRRAFVERNAWSTRADAAVRMLQGQAEEALVPIVRVSKAHSL